MNKEINLGEYLTMPPTFEKLLQVEKELNKEGYSLDRDFGLILQADRFAYDVTPYDVITFASIGADGIHYGLLTDFGCVSDLENAFVVCISPMDFGNHIKIVARNLREFIGLACTMKDAAAISNFQYFEKEEQYKKYLNESQQNIDGEFTKRADYVITKLRSVIECELIDDVYDYVERKVKTERENQIIISTLDGIGIVPMENKVGIHKQYQLEKDMEIDLHEVKSFFNTATVESKLAFIRDAQFTFLMQDELKLKDAVIEEMHKLDLKDELVRLKNPY